VRAPPPSETDIDILDLERYAEAWQGIADLLRAHEFKRSPFEAAMREMSDAVKVKEHSNATARVTKAKERIERVRNGKDAGLKAPFDPNNLVHLAAGANVVRVANGQYLIDGNRLRKIVNLEVNAAALEQTKRVRLGGRQIAGNAAKRHRRAGAGTTNSSKSNATGGWRARRGGRGR
jgi:hypothetical protein